MPEKEESGQLYSAAIGCFFRAQEKLGKGQENPVKISAILFCGATLLAPLTGITTAKAADEDGCTKVIDGGSTDITVKWCHKDNSAGPSVEVPPKRAESMVRIDTSQGPGGGRCGFVNNPMGNGCK
jgi:hypothetical protein